MFFKFRVTVTLALTLCIAITSLKQGGLSVCQVNIQKCFGWLEPSFVNQLKT